MEKNSLIVGEAARLRCVVNNRQSNVATSTVRVQLWREIVAKAKASDSGEPRLLEDKQIVLEHVFPMKVAKEVPDLVAEEFNFLLIKTEECDKEKGRFFYELDYLEDCLPVCQEIKNMQ